MILTEKEEKRVSLLSKLDIKDLVSLLKGRENKDIYRAAIIKKESLKTFKNGELHKTEVTKYNEIIK